MRLSILLILSLVLLSGCAKHTTIIIYENVSTPKQAENVSTPIITFLNTTNVTSSNTSDSDVRFVYVPITKDNITHNYVRTKDSNCTYNNWPYQDFNCTPGNIIPNATKEIICVSGYSGTVRNVSENLKDEVYADYNINRVPYAYEIDHVISLELGGSNDISNLWPEKYNDTYGARVKDKVENLLHSLVCNSNMSLSQAQYDISHNWTKYVVVK